MTSSPRCPYKEGSWLRKIQPGVRIRRIHLGLGYTDLYCAGPCSENGGNVLRNALFTSAVSEP
jgi:hypothetical protein